MITNIEELISDIRKSGLNIRPPRNLWDEADVSIETELEDLAFAEKYFEGEKEPIEDITGINHHLLPSVEKLSVAQQTILAKELEHLLQHYNFYLDFPKDLPTYLKYPVIINFWKESHVAVSFGENHIELCDMEKENCPFPGYCKTCDEVAAQMKHDEETETGEIDNDFDVDNLLLTPKEIEDWHKKQNIIEQDEEPSDPFGDTTDVEDYFEEINGFYNDDGEKINPESVPVPGLCILCKSYQSDDWEENLLCLMNRYDQRNDKDFKCGVFEKA